VAPNTLIAAHVIEYKPASKRPLEEVQAVVKEAVTQAEAKKLAKKAGEAKLAALKAKDDAAGFGDVKTVSRNKQGVDRAALLAIMKADASKLPAYVGVELPGQGYNVYRLSKVAQPATPDTARRQTEQQQVTNAMAQQEMLAYIDLLKQKTKVQLMKSATLVSAAPKDPAGTDIK
jgi:peptidyl-prolyl cis-trans isomerase D